MSSGLGAAVKRTVGVAVSALVVIIVVSYVGQYQTDARLSLLEHQLRPTPPPLSLTVSGSQRKHAIWWV